MTTLTVYLFDKDTREYRGTYEAQESPMERGIHIKPTSSTETPVPNLPTGKTAIFENGNWVIVPIPTSPTIPPHVLTEQELVDAAKAEILGQIQNLEREQMLPRVVREALMATAVTLAQTAGVTEPQLYAANIAYKKMKDFDAQIAALRAQL